MDVIGNIRKVIAFVFRAGAFTVTIKADDTPALSPKKNITLNVVDGDSIQTIVSDSSANTLTNKTINSDSNTLTIDTADAYITINADDAKATITNIDSDNIKDGGIETIDIADDAITNSKIATDAVTSDSIQAGAVGTDEIADDAVTAAKINADLAGEGLTQAAGGELDVNVDDSTIEINADVVRVKASGITDNEIADDAVDTDAIQDLAVTDAKINDVEASKITGSFPELYLENGTSSIVASSISVPDDATFIKITPSGSGLVNNFNLVTAVADRTYLLQNTTGSNLTITGTGNIEPGTDDDITLEDGATIAVYWDGNQNNIVGGTGSGGGSGGGLELLYINDTDSPVSAQISKHYLTNTTSGTITVNLPEASTLSATDKKRASIRITDSSETWTNNNVVLVPFSGEKIDGFAIDESFELDVTGSWLELSWDDDLSHWALDLAGVGGGSGGGGGLTIEEYAYNAIPATLSLNIHYLVDFGGGSNLNAASTMPDISDAGAIRVTPINNGGGCTVTLTRGSTDQFNDPELGLDTEYILDVGSATFNTNINDFNWEITDAYWATSTDAGVIEKESINLTGLSVSGTNSVSQAELSGTRIGDLVVLNIKLDVETSSASFMELVGQLPASFSPDEVRSGVFIYDRNTVIEQGIIFLETNGDIRLYRGLGLTNNWISGQPVMTGPGVTARHITFCYTTLG